METLATVPTHIVSISPRLIVNGVKRVCLLPIGKVLRIYEVHPYSDGRRPVISLATTAESDMWLEVAAVGSGGR